VGYKVVYIIAISSKKETKFFEDAKIIIESNIYNGILQNTYIGSQGLESIRKQLKNTESYIKDRRSCGIVVYTGSVSKL